MAKLDFPGQHVDEKLLFHFNQHVIVMRKGLYGLLLPLAVMSIPFLIWSNNVALLWLPLIGFVFGCFIFLYHWIGWHFSVFIVTDERIRQLTQKGLFRKTVIDLDLDKIQNISYNIPGFTGELLGYGTIVLQTIVGDMVLNKISHCEQIYNQLSDAIHVAGGKTDQIVSQEANE